ncbi:13660_t:CDS:1, partial [Cetraspora pellucida]
LKKKDGTPFKVKLVHNCYTAFANYLHKNSAMNNVQLWNKYSFPRALQCLDEKIKSLQNAGYGYTSK